MYNDQCAGKGTKTMEQTEENRQGDMMEQMKIEYGLLTEEQVFGEEPAEVIRALGAACEVTDYAVLRGAKAVSSSKGRTASWLLSSVAGYGDVSAVDEEGCRAVAYAASKGNLRPVIPCADPSLITDVIRRDISGFARAEYGEYPQTAAERTLARTLQSEFSEGRLIKTGKTFDGMYEELVYRGEKYIRVPCEATDPVTLSDGREYRAGDAVWIRVLPVQWLQDQSAQMLISCRILVGDVPFSGENYYDGEFRASLAWALQNGTFAEDLVPSRIPEMTADEEAEYEAQIARAAKRRNPYGLRFGQVSEEDIIRGAIESDVPVFLHGPSSEGKSARVRQIDPTCEIIYLRNATPDSLNGRSVYNQATGEMIDIPPTWYQKVKAKCEEEPDKLHVVFFDEINNALPGIQGMAFNIVLDREVNGLWKLPANARVVAAGNDMQDSLAANQIAAPFSNRFAHVYINTTTEKWLAWARENHIHPAIYSYIAYRRGETLRSRYDGEKPNADPRKWEMASRMLYATGRPEMLRALIGEEITEEFVQFCAQPVITLEDVLSGNFSQQEIDALNTAGRYATAMGLSQAEEEDVETVRDFLSGMGEEFRAVFDELRKRGGHER